MTTERGSWTSASNAAADSLCPGKHLAQQGVAEPEKDASATHGTAIHDAIAKGNPEGLTLPQRETYEACITIAARLAMEFFKDALPPAMISERRLWAQWNVPIDGAIKEIRHSGKLDRIYIGPQDALILEFKTLAGEVASSPKNMQLRDQAVLAWGNSAIPTDTPGTVEYRIKRIATAVVQPFVTHKPEVCVYEEPDLVRAATEMSNRVLASNDPKSPRIPGDAQCKFCLAKTKCPEYHKFATSLLPDLPKSIVDTHIADWNGPQFAQFLAGRAIAQAWLDNAWEAAKARLMANGDIPGYGLKDGNSVRSIDNPQLVFDRFVQLPAKNGVKFEDRLKAYMACVSVSMTDLKSAVSTLTGLTGKKLDEKVDELLTDAVTVTKNKPSIVKKKAITQ